MKDINRMKKKRAINVLCCIDRKSSGRANRYDKPKEQLFPTSMAKDASEYTLGDVQENG